LLFQAIIVQVITFIGLALVLRKVLMKSSYSETRRLQQLNEENAQKARELTGKIADAENEYREKMAKAEEEIIEMKARAKKEVEEIKEIVIAKGKTESDRIVAQALGAKEEIRLEIEEQMQEKVVDFSHKVFQKILNSEEQKLVHDGLLGNIFKELDKVEKSRLQAVGQNEAFDGKAAIKTSRPISAEHKKKLEAILSSKLGQKITVQETVEKKIMAGIVIALGSFIIDGSLSEQFKKAAQELK